MKQIYLCLVLKTLFFAVNGTDIPIIGILSQEVYSVKQYFKSGDNFVSFIAASYVKYIESCGARVIPVWTGQNEEYYNRVVKYTNGLVFPGGATYFNETDGYGETAKILYNLAKANNDKEIYYPIWGTCLGMEVFAFAALNGKDVRTDCVLKKVSLPLNFSEDYRKSKMFANASEDIIDILQSKNVTYNFHRYCLTQSILKEEGLLEDWTVLSTNDDEKNLEFVSIMESKSYPFYGVQFHPEKNIFEFKRNSGIPHTPEAIKASQYFANFFVNECRRNNNEFPNIILEDKALIYNYIPAYTGVQNSAYEQLYFFTKSDIENNQLI